MERQSPRLDLSKYAAFPNITQRLVTLVEGHAGYPVMKMGETLDKLLERFQKTRAEFMLSLVFDPGLIESAAVRGIFPMSINLKPPVLAYSRVRKKKSKKFTITIDAKYDEVCEMVVAEHGKDWLCDKLRLAYNDIRQRNNSRPLLTDKTVMRIYSIEAYNEQGDLVAGELGYTTGSCYTSLTGFCVQADAGSALLGAVGVLLQHFGFSVWDLGMNMEYKERMGGSLIPRSEFLQLMTMLTETDRVLTGLPWIPQPAVSAHDIINDPQRVLPHSEHAPERYTS